MLITGTDQVRSVSLAPPDADKPISLSERVSGMQTAAVGISSPTVSNTSDDGPAIDPTLEYDLEEIYQWLVANKDAMVDDPKLLLDGIIYKLKNITRSDGSSTYRTFNDISSACTMLRKRCDDTGYGNDGFFDQLRGTVFGMQIFFDQLKNQIFFNTENDSNDKFF